MINIYDLVEKRNKLLPKDWMFVFNQAEGGLSTLDLYYKNRILCSLRARTEPEIMSIPFFVENLQIFYPNFNLDKPQSTIVENSSEIIKDSSQVWL